MHLTSGFKRVFQMALAALLLSVPAGAQGPKAYEGLTFHKAPQPLHDDARTGDWEFLGPGRTCHSPETRIAKTWPTGGPPLVWEMARGDGFTCPVISGRRLVFTHRVGNETHVDCIDAETGKRFWRFSSPCDFKPRYISDGGPRSSPVISDGKVYVHEVRGTLRCFDLVTGKVLWARDLAKELQAPEDFFGAVSTPIVYGDVIIQNVGAPGACVVAFDKQTGKVVWRAGDEWGPSCCSPVLGSVHGKDRLFVLAGGESRPPTGGLLVLDPSTGKVDFQHPFRSRTYESVLGSSPVVGDNWVFLSSSYNVGTAVLSLDEKGGYEQLWKDRSVGLQFSNAVLVDGLVYAIDGRSDRAGAVICIDPATGKELFRSDLDFDEMITRDGAKKKINLSIGEGSLLWVDGGFLCLGDNGHLLRLEITPKGVKVVSRAWLFGANQSWTPLALSRGLLYVCQNRRERFGDRPARLLCYDLRAR